MWTGILNKKKVTMETVLWRGQKDLQAPGAWLMANMKGSSGISIWGKQHINEKTAVKESMWLIHTFIHYHVQIVFWWYKAVVRLQCSPSCCLYCSKKRKYQHDQRVKRYFGKYKLCVKKASRHPSNVMWGEKTSQKYHWAASVSAH